MVLAGSPPCPHPPPIIPAPADSSSPHDDADVPRWIADLGVPGLVDLHVHFMPASVQRKVWGYFDALPVHGHPAWPVTYRHDDEERVRVLRSLGVRAYTTLN